MRWREIFILILRSFTLTLLWTTQSFNGRIFTNRLMRRRENWIKGWLTGPNELSKLNPKTPTPQNPKSDMKIMSRWTSRRFTIECLMMCWRIIIMIGMRKMWEGWKIKCTFSDKSLSKMLKLWTWFSSQNIELSRLKSWEKVWNFWILTVLKKIQLKNSTTAAVLVCQKALEEANLMKSWTKIYPTRTNSCLHKCLNLTSETSNSTNKCPDIDPNDER